MIGKNEVIVIALFALLATGVVSAQTVVGGGTDLPKSLFDEILPSGQGLTDFSYTVAKNDSGKTAFLRNGTWAAEDNGLRDESQLDRPGWSTLQSVHFAASEFALTQAELDAYNAARERNWGPLIQVPVAATTVLLPYKRFGIKDLNLSDAQMCAIFSNKTGGQTWGQLRGVVDSTTVKVAYRMDANGDTEMLSRYLVAACPTSGFKVSNSFATVMANVFAGGGLPQHWIGMYGAFGVLSVLSEGHIAYVHPGRYTLPFDSDNGVVARINGNLPTADSIQAALATQLLPLGAATRSPLAWDSVYAKPAPARGTGSKYPIFGTTKLLVNQCYKDAVVQGKIIAFLTGLFGTTYDSSVTDQHFVNLPSTGSTNNWKAALVKTFLTSSSNLSIGNTNVCNGIGRPLSN